MQPTTRLVPPVSSRQPMGEGHAAVCSICRRCGISRSVPYRIYRPKKRLICSCHTYIGASGDSERRRFRFRCAPALPPAAARRGNDQLGRASRAPGDPCGGFRPTGEPDGGEDPGNGDLWCQDEQQAGAPGRGVLHFNQFEATSEPPRVQPARSRYAACGRRCEP